MGTTSDAHCPFCEELAKMKDTVEYHQQVRPDDTKYKFSVALVQEMFLDKDWRTGKSTHYSLTVILVFSVQQ